MTTRQLIVMDYFPSEVNGIARIRPLDEDVREVRDRLNSQLRERAAQWHQSGWVEAEEGITYTLTEGGKGIVAHLEMRLPD